MLEQMCAYCSSFLSYFTTEKQYDYIKSFKRSMKSLKFALMCCTSTHGFQAIFSTKNNRMRKMMVMR